MNNEKINRIQKTLIGILIFSLVWVCIYNTTNFWFYFPTWGRSISFEVNRVIMIIGLIILYLFPIIYGITKKHIKSIALINVLLGWSVLGWIGALIWAINSPNKSEVKEVEVKEFKYKCKKCGYVNSIDQEISYFVCKQCGTENEEQ